MESSFRSSRLRDSASGFCAGSRVNPDPAHREIKCRREILGDPVRSSQSETQTVARRSQGKLRPADAVLRELM